MNEMIEMKERLGNCPRLEGEREGGQGDIKKIPKQWMLRKRIKSPRIGIQCGRCTVDEATESKG